MMTPGPKKQASIEKEMPLVAHLLELRARLLWSLLFFVVAFAALYPFSQHIFAHLVMPLADLLGGDETRRLIYTGLPEAFLTYLKVTLFSAFMVSFPMIALHVWRFVMPGLYKSERKTFFVFMFSTPFLFIVGAAFAFYGVIPMAWKFFLNYESSAVITGLPI